MFLNMEKLFMGLRISNDCVKAVAQGDDTDGWESDLGDAQSAYDGIMSYTHGWEVVARGDSTGEEFYYDRMGKAASSVFSRKVYWEKIKGNNIVVGEVELADTALDGNISNERLIEVAKEVAEKEGLDASGGRYVVYNIVGQEEWSEWA